MPIPKIIHYCWFGNNQKPKIFQQCLKSWKLHLKEYEIIEWNENNTNLEMSNFLRQSYEQRRFAFVSDYVRVWALKTYGGIYLDIDNEMVAPFSSEILSHEVILGTDDAGYLTSLMGTVPEHVYFRRLLKLYNKINFIKEDGSQNVVTNNTWMQEVLSHFGYIIENRTQMLESGIKVYKDDIFHARSLTTGKYHITKDTVSIHHHSLSWIPLKTRVIRFLRIYVVIPLIGKKRYVKISNSFNG